MLKKNDFVRAISSIVLGSLLAILLCAPSVQAQEGSQSGLVILSGEEKEIDYDVHGLLEIYGTAILRGDAKADFILAYPGANAGEQGSTVHIYGCAPNNSLGPLSAEDSQFEGLDPVVTIYGYRFRVDSGLSFAPPVDMPISGTLYVLNEMDEEQFNIWIASDVDILLRAPESEELERVEAKLKVSPSVMNLNRRYPVVFGMICLPEGITKDDIDRDYPLMIYTLENDYGVEAKYKRIFDNSCRNKSAQVKICAFFNIGQLLKNLPNNCEEMQLEVRGRLTSEQEFYGKDKIKILKPRRKHWTYMKNWKSQKPHSRR